MAYYLKLFKLSVRPALIWEQIYSRKSFVTGMDRGDPASISVPPSEGFLFWEYGWLCEEHLTFVSHHLEALVILGFLFLTMTVCV